MKKRILCLLLALTLWAALLPAAGAVDSNRVMGAALSQLGYTEGEKELTQYGQWYGIPDGYWCDMFASWCGWQAGMPLWEFPKAASCSRHVEAFRAMGAFRESQARGGWYVPQQGDLIFFYNPVTEPEGEVSYHVGLVLYVENGLVHTVEGNALANRADCPEQFLRAERDESADLPDRVMINHYPLDYTSILGYGLPAYSSRTAVTLTGFVDLQGYESRAALFARLAQEGIMEGTSAHTYSPSHGMSRGDFLVCVMELCGLSGWEEDTQPFADVPADSPWYEAVMAARSAGIVRGGSNNCFLPQRYISGAAAQTILSNTLHYLNLSVQEFCFTHGSYADYGDLTIRADLAVALDQVSKSLPLMKTCTTPITLEGKLQSWPALQANGVIYVAVSGLKEQFPGLVMERFDPQQKQEEGRLPRRPAEWVTFTDRWFVIGGQRVQLTGFEQEGEFYTPLRPAAAALGLKVTWNSGEKSIALGK